MSDANAVAILAGLTSWWSLDGDLLDAHGANDLTGAVVAGYSPGLHDDQLDLGSRAGVVLAAPIAYSASAGKFSIGGWIEFEGGGTAIYVFGLTAGVSNNNEALYITVGATGIMTVFGWEALAADTYYAQDTGPRRTSYPITVRVEDAATSATSNQVIQITESGNNPAGRYFITATYDEGTVKLYMDSVLVASGVADSVHLSPITYFQIGQDFGAGLSSCATDELFLLDTLALTQAQISYLYAMGAGKSYTNLLADAA